MSVAHCAAEILRESRDMVKDGKAAPAGDSSNPGGNPSIPIL